MGSYRIKPDNFKLSLYQSGKRKYWVIDADPHVVALVKRVFPKAFRAPEVVSSGVYTKTPLLLNDTPANAADLVWFTARHKPIIGDNDRRYLEQREADHRQRQLKVEEFFESPPPLEAMLLKDMYPHQETAVQLVQVVNRCLVADDLGLGKTVTGLGVTSLSSGLPALIVCPTHLIRQWVEKIHEFVCFPTVQVLEGVKPYPLEPVYYYVTSYNRLAAWSEHLTRAGLRTVIFDEVHELRKLETQKRVAARLISETADRVVGLSATPIYNFCDEVYSVMDVIDPGSMGDQREFQLSWGGSTVTDTVGLGRWLRAQGFMIRRTAEEVGIHAGDLISDVVTMDCSLEELQRIEHVAVALAQKALTSDMLSSGLAAREFDTRLRQATGLAKSHAVADFVNQLLTDGAPRVLVFAWHKEVYARLLTRLHHHKPTTYNGDDSPTQKARALKSFTEGDSKVLLMSLRSGEGIDGLQKVCNHIVFAELDWSPSRHAQCIGRLQRPGQVHPVYAYYPVVEDGSDPPMIDLLGVKKGLRDGLVDLLEGEVGDLPVKRVADMAQKYLESRQGKSNLHAGVTTSTLGAALTEYLRTVPITGFLKEADLQEHLHEKLAKVFPDVEFTREYRFAPTERIDFLAKRGDRAVGIELKIKGERSEVYRQLKRYTSHVKELILVCPWPLHDFVVEGVSVHVACYSRNSRSMQ